MSEGNSVNNQRCRARPSNTNCLDGRARAPTNLRFTDPTNLNEANADKAIRARRSRAAGSTRRLHVLTTATPLLHETILSRGCSYSLACSPFVRRVNAPVRVRRRIVLPATSSRPSASNLRASRGALSGNRASARARNPPGGGELISGRGVEAKRVAGELHRLHAIFGREFLRCRIGTIGGHPIWPRRIRNKQFHSGSLRQRT
jgi:hypothetical protein